MDKREIKKAHKMLISGFLVRYYDVRNFALARSFNRLTHKELKFLLPSYGIELLSFDFEEVEPYQLENGEVVLVKDVFNNPAPYANPRRFTKLENGEIILAEDKYYPKVLRKEFDYYGKH